MPQEMHEEESYVYRTPLHSRIVILIVLPLMVVPVAAAVCVIRWWLAIFPLLFFVALDLTNSVLLGKVIVKRDQLELESGGLILNLISWYRRRPIVWPWEHYDFIARYTLVSGKRVYEELEIIYEGKVRFTLPGKISKFAEMVEKIKEFNPNLKIEEKKWG